MKIIAIIQARMSSSRLPGKTMMQICNKPLIEHIVNRVTSCNQIEEVILATSNDSSDDILYQWAKNHSITCYRGSLEDVLDRFYNAAALNYADVVVRITGDCPLIDPGTIDEVVQGFIQGDYDLYSLGGAFPDGLDCQVFSFKSALEVAWKQSTLLSEREHVCPYIENNPALFKLGALEKFSSDRSIRLTLDQQEDFELINKIYEHLYYKNPLFDIHTIFEFLDNNPALLDINSAIIRNEGYYKSLALDNKQKNN